MTTILAIKIMGGIAAAVVIFLALAIIDARLDSHIHRPPRR